MGTFAIQLAKHLGAAVATTTSASNFDLVRGLGVDVIVDYKNDDFETKLSGYDLVLHSQDGEALDKSLRVLRAGGRLVSISGPPDPAFAKEIGAPWFVKLFIRASSLGARRKAKSLDVTFTFRHEEFERALDRADIEILVRAYLSPEHRDAAETGCPVAALASEVARHARATRQTFASHNGRTLDLLAASLPSRRGKAVGRADAAALLGLLAGTLQLARATPDRAESDAILAAGVRAAIRLAK